MADYSKILEIVDIASYIYSDYILGQLKTKKMLEIISKIIHFSNKTVSEAISVFFYVLKYLSRDVNILTKLEETDSFEKYVRTNLDLIIELSIQNKNQANFPHRALPLFEIFNKMITGSPIAVIELGASYGLIGRCLLAPDKVLENKNRYFSPGQRIPQNPQAIDYYLGIELTPPDKEWILACIWDPGEEELQRNFIDEIPTDNRFQLLKGDAFGFSGLKSVKNLAAQPFTIVVLTSFIFYQLENHKQKKLKNEISTFVNATGSHWVNQTLNISSSPTKDEYFIEWDQKRIIKLTDVKCANWKWIQ